jgi:hypothetical protein
MTKPTFVRVTTEARGADRYVFIFSLTGSPLFGESVNKAGSTRSAYRKVMRNLRAWCAKETRPAIANAFGPATRSAHATILTSVGLLRKAGTAGCVADAKLVLRECRRMRTAIAA